LSGKWLELLKEIAPNITRVAVLRDPTLGSSTSQFAVIRDTPCGLNEGAEVELESLRIMPDTPMSDLRRWVHA
jgi:hypothetical protein